MAYPQSKESDDRTLSPYFFVKTEDSAIDQLPLKATSAQVNISGIIADVQVTQVYRNEGKKPLEALYIFPASTRAAVYGLKMTIGERVINAKVSKREEARREYEKAAQQGKSASLLEQQRPNVFQMNVANIMPGDEIKVELKYTELLVPTGWIYEFIYPTVVGPRYSNRSADAPPSEHWVENPYLHEKEAPFYAFDMKVTIAAGTPIKEIACTSHKVNVSYDRSSVARITLDKSEEQGGNRDYILHYRLDGDRIQSGLLLYEGEKENFFLLTMQPPKRMTKAQILDREYIFIVDVSGSMIGYPLDISKKLLKDLLGGLRPSDKFNVILFSGASSIMSEQSVPATAENIQRAIKHIEQQRGGGGTELLPALKRALGLPKTEHYSRTVVIATDGYVEVEEEVFDLIRKNLGNANIFAFGIGTSVNRHIIEGMARVGMGEPFIITRPEEAASRAEQLRAIIQSPVLTGINVKFDDFAAYDVEPLAIPDLLSERPVIVFGKYRGKRHGKITLSGISGEGRYSETLDVGKTDPMRSNSVLCYLWARHRIALLSDYNKLRPDDKRVKAVTDLGLTYNLLTAYTSFVAIDTEVCADGKTVTVKQPLPMPQGVSDYAVGGLSGSIASSGAYGSSFPGGTSMLGRQDFMPKMKITTEYNPQGMPAPRDYGRKLYQGKAGRGEESNTRGSPIRTIKVTDIKVSGGLSEESVSKVLQHHIHSLEKCCQGSDVDAQLVVKITMGANGSVKAVKIVKGTRNGGTAERCIAGQVEKWQFPAAQDGKEATITISLVVSV
jgi:Ca-activated chloride channel family protein